MASDKAQSWVYCEQITPPDRVVTAARERAEYLGCLVPSPASAQTLQVLAAASNAKAVIEVGTGVGVSGLHLLRGMSPDGVLTTIDVEIEHQQAAREAFADDRVRPTRVRAICGRAVDVLPRLTDSGYDLVVIDADPENASLYMDHASRLLRRGGIAALVHALWHDQVANPARRDDVTTAVRALADAIITDDRWVTTMLPTGDGLLVAVRR